MADQASLDAFRGEVRSFCESLPPTLTHQVVSYITDEFAINRYLKRIVILNRWLGDWDICLNDLVRAKRESRVLRCARDRS